MAEDQKPPVRKAPSKQLAFRVWLETDRPSFRVLAAELGTRGYKVDSTTLNRWARAMPNWASAIVEATTEKVPPEKIITALEGAEEDAAAFVPEHIIGVKAQLIARLYTTIKKMPIDNMEDWQKGLDACDRIESLIHAERGKAVAAQDPIAKPRGATISILNRLNPNVQMAPFKKPDPAGAN